MQIMSPIHQPDVYKCFCLPLMGPLVGMGGSTGGTLEEEAAAIASGEAETVLVTVIVTSLVVMMISRGENEIEFS